MDKTYDELKADVARLTTELRSSQATIEYLRSYLRDPDAPTISSAPENGPVFHFTGWMPSTPYMITTDESSGTLIAVVSDSPTPPDADSDEN